MMRLLVILFILISGVAQGTGRDKKYPVATIDKELLENANAVVRNAEETFTIEALDKSVYHLHMAITIFNKKADDNALIYEVYRDKLSKITEFEANVYDGDGEEIVRLKNADIHDESAISGFSLFEDGRVQYADMSQVIYPYTVEYTIELTFNSLYIIPNFRSHDDEFIAVENRKYTLLFPPELAPRYKEYNFTGKRTENVVDGISRITWSFDNLKAIEVEKMGKGLQDVISRVVIAPVKFEYDGHAGNMSSWQEFGRWIYKLQEGRDIVPEATAQKIRKMTEGLSRREKIAAIYHYMQEKTRYVSIQLGIGGLQSFEASLVDEVGYGDCKALSNYTKSLLKTVGIDGYYVCVGAGRNITTLDSDFADNTAFNHVILCVPDQQDTIWLECTSQTNPFGYMGSFTGNRQVLLISEDGGKIVSTPVYNEQDNLRVRKATITFSKEGQAEASIETNYRGLQYESYGLSEYVHMGEKDQKDWIHGTTEIPSYELLDFNFEEKKSILPEARVELKLFLPNYASASGKRFYFEPNLLSKLVVNLPSYEKRKTHFFIREGYTKLDTLEFHFPSDYQSEYLPEPKEITSAFGVYHNGFSFEQGKLIYSRELVLKPGEYSPEEYNDYLQFLRAVAKEDKKKVVFTTKT